MPSRQRLGTRVVAPDVQDRRGRSPGAGGRPSGKPRRRRSTHEQGRQKNANDQEHTCQRNTAAEHQRLGQKDKMQLPLGPRRNQHGHLQGIHKPNGQLGPIEERPVARIVARRTPRANRMRRSGWRRCSGPTVDPPARWRYQPSPRRTGHGPSDRDRPPIRYEGTGGDVPNDSTSLRHRSPNRRRGRTTPEQPRPVTMEHSTSTRLCRARPTLVREFFRVPRYLVPAQD